MSRTNHYSLCEECNAERYCSRHERPWSTYTHKPEREIISRRIWKRKNRWPRFSIRYHHHGPSRSWRQEEHGHARAVYRQMIHRDEDPALPPEKYLIDLRGWY